MFLPQIGTAKQFAGFKRGGRPRIDWTHPLTRGLVAAYVPDNPTAVIDLCGRGPTLFPNGTATPTGRGMVLTSEGLALPQAGANNSNNGYSGVIGTANTAFTNLFAKAGSVFWRGVITDNLHSGDGGAMGIISDPNVTPFKAFLLQPNNGSNRVNVLWNSGGTFTQQQGFSAAFTIRIVQSLAMTYKVGGFVNAYQFDGSLSANFPASFGASAPQFTGGLNKVVLGGAAGDGLPGNHMLGYFFNVEKTSAEIRALTADPYCFLIYPEDDISSLLVTGLVPLALASLSGAMSRLVSIPKPQFIVTAKSVAQAKDAANPRAFAGLSAVSDSQGKSAAAIAPLAAVAARSAGQAKAAASPLPQMVIAARIQGQANETSIPETPLQLSARSASAARSSARFGAITLELRGIIASMGRALARLVITHPRPPAIVCGIPSERQLYVAEGTESMLTDVVTSERQVFSAEGAENSC